MEQSCLRRFLKNINDYLFFKSKVFRFVIAIFRLQYKNYEEIEIIVKKAKEKKIKVYGLSSYGTKREIPSILLGFATLSEEKLKEGVKLFLEI